MALYGLNEKNHIICKINSESKGQVCMITYNDMEAKQIYEDLKFYTENRALLFRQKI